MSTIRRKARKVNKNVIHLRRLLFTTGLICLSYLVAYAILYGRGDAERPDGFLNSDLNFTLYFLIGSCYVVYIASAIRSFSLGDKYKTTFRWFWLLGVALTMCFLLLLIMNFITTGDNKPAEFIDLE